MVNLYNQQDKTVSNKFIAEKIIKQLTKKNKENLCNQYTRSPDFLYLLFSAMRKEFSFNYNWLLW